MTPLNRAEAIVGAVVALLVGVLVGGVGGMVLGDRHGTALGNAKVAELRRQYAEQAATAASAAAKKLASETDRGNRLSAALLKAESQIDDLTEQLSKRVERVTTVYREAPGAALQPLPHCIFTRGWLRDYNAAIGAPVPPTGQASGPPVEAPGAGQASAAEDELLPADIGPADILSHHIEYGGRCRQLEEQLNRLIDYEEGHDAEQ
ncbi:hypothetical protein [Cupriavidus gilardii]|uniref:hypothetical protein n=1 Tax=Cupriavidus gilardii TaxID=82541 RepID=UPI0021B4848F|nr:hypothetical protein [Cupriavidus gilardii]UXC35144.1 hypothetical protein N4G38_12085 [Cupriavidus gilardii]